MKQLFERCVFIDFEFRNVTSELVDLVCCTTEYKNDVKEWWLYQDQSKQKELKDYLNSLKKEIVVGYSTVAEARSFLSLSLEPLDFKWIDLFIEYRCLTNHNDRLNWGKQLKDGKVINAVKPPPKWERTEEDNFTSFKHTHSLAEATYKLTGKIRDTEHKNAMRDLIISDAEFTEEDKIAIQNYCTEDVIFLKEILKAELKEYREQEVPNDLDLVKEMLQRGRYSAITAKMESWGYPIDYEATKNFSNSVGPILEDCQREINSLFPDIKPFKYKKIDKKFTWDQKATREWLKVNVDVNRWTRTDSGELSLSLEAWTKVFDFKHDYPKDNFGAQIVRYLKLKQNLNGFTPNPKKRSFWDSVGPDKRVRPYMNIYGSQSSRSQPSSTSFLFLKPAWMRALCVPPPGKAIVSFDYGSEEFLISALWAEDQNMIESYASGDVYLNYAKLVGAVPPEGTKEQYKSERNAYKAILLGLSYLMSKYGLAVHLTNNTEREWTEEEAQQKINEFQKTFKGLTNKQEEIQKIYAREGKIKLPCGWYMFGDNDNHRSVCNVPVQGCLHGDSRVLTKLWGYLKIQDLVGKNRIEVWDGEKFVLADCVASGPKKLIIITTSSGRKIKCSPEHRFWTIDVRGKGKWKKYNEFSKVERIRLSYESKDFDSNFILEPLTKIKSTTGKDVGLEDYTGSKYELGIILGRLASDGWVSRGRGLSWCIAEHELNIFDYLKDLISKFGLSLKIKIKDRTKEDRKKLYFIHIYSNRLERQLIEILNIKNDLTHNYFWHSKELIRGFLTGYIDGDGGISGEAVKIAFGKGEDRLKYAESIFKMFDVFGIKACIYRYPYRTNIGIRKRDLFGFSNNFKFLNKHKQTKLEKILASCKNLSSKIGVVDLVESVEVTEQEVEMYDIANCPEQRFMTEGVVTHNTGASIMRKAVDLAVSRGLKVIITLHDAIYCEYDAYDFKAIDILHDCMKKAFIYYFDDKESASLIRLDGFSWSPDYPAPKKHEKGGRVYSEIKTPSGLTIEIGDKYIDERAIKEFEQFSKYFENREESYL